MNDEKRLESEKEFILNLREVEVEQEIDKYRKMDLSKVVGNIVHQRAGDIGLDDKARDMYHNGQASLTMSMMNMFKGIIENSDLVFFIRKAIIAEIDKAMNINH